MTRTLAALLGAALLAGTACADAFLIDDPHVPGQLVVRWRQPAQPPAPVPVLGRPLVRGAPSAFDQSIARLLQRLGLRPVAVLREGRVWLLGSDPALSDPDLADAARELRASSLTDAVAANSLVYFEDSGVPNDPEFSTQWALDPSRVDAPGAWAITTGSPQVVVAVLDTGVEIDHPDLAANVWTHACEDVDGDGQVDPSEKDGEDTPCPGDAEGNGLPDDFHGWNFVSMNADVSDTVPHGTHVAGIVAAVTDNQIGVAGLAQVRLAVVKVSGAFVGNVTRVAAGIDYAVDLGVDAMNASFTTVNHFLLDSAVQGARDAGIVIVAAAGRGQYAGADLAIYPTYPAAYPYPNVIAVTSTTAADGLDPFANYGASVVEIGAPGTAIRSTLAGGYFDRTGTSMAAPHVTGVVALIRSIRPAASVEEIRNCLRHGDALPALAGKTEWGVRLDARQAVETCAPKGPLGKPGRPALVP